MPNTNQKKQPPYYFFNKKVKRKEGYWKKFRSEPPSSQIIAVTTLLALITAVFLWYETNRQVDVAQGALLLAQKQDSSNHANTQRSLALAESSFVATKRSIEFAEKNLELSNRSFQVGNRPEIIIKDFYFLPIDSGFIKYRFNLKNDGNMVADNACYIATITIQPISKSLSKDMVDKECVSVSDLSKGSEIEVTTGKFKFTKEIINKVFAKTHYLYARGRIYYSDIYNRKYWTSFCFIYNTENTKNIIIYKEGNEVR